MKPDVAYNSEANIPIANNRLESIRNPTSAIES